MIPQKPNQTDYISNLLSVKPDGGKKSIVFLIFWNKFQYYED